MTSVLIGESCCVALWQREHRTCEYLVRFSVLFGSLPMFCIFILVFTVRLSRKNLYLSPTSVKKVLLELHVFKCDRWMIRRDWTLASSVVVV